MAASGVRQRIYEGLGGKVVNLDEKRELNQRIAKALGQSVKRVEEGSDVG